ncbi:MAG: hypothetical protein GKR95_11965 [Gammaproteobacteria bacterium]|nr:hypothetical protein [Gammaproteobacteria bacterium]NKB62793.1 hypothetical protein [Gammaproteobacteria bacterium]
MKIIRPHYQNRLHSATNSQAPSGLSRLKLHGKATLIILSAVACISIFGATVPLGKWEQALARAQGKQCDPSNPNVIERYPLD